MLYFKALFGFLLSFAIIDSLWIAFVVRKMYRSEIPHMLAASTDMIAGVLFYITYAAASVFLLLPAIQTGKAITVLLTGAVIGLLTYGTYSFTNKAVLDGWTYSLVVPDVLWGIFLTAVCGYFAFLASRVGG